MAFLNEEYEDVHAQHDRYKGYRVFPNKSAVENRFQKEPEQRGDKHEVTYLSFCYQTSQMYTHDTGMQFC